MSKTIYSLLKSKYVCKYTFKNIDNTIQFLRNYSKIISTSLFSVDFLKWVDDELIGFRRLSSPERGGVLFS